MLSIILTVYLKPFKFNAIFQCLDAKWTVSNYQNGHKEFNTGMEGLSERETIDRCNDQCGDRSCNRLKPEDFLNHEGCQRNGFHRL